VSASPEETQEGLTGDEIIPVEAEPSTDAGRAANARQIRGSSLLLVGRMLGLAVDFVAQVLIVQHLSKTDYGSFALAMSIVAVGTTICLLGLERTVGRFAPIYQEHGDYGRMWGTITVVVGTVATLGLAVVLAVHALQGLIGGVVDNDLALSLLLVMILLSPLTALDSLLISLFATFGSARSIFFRRYVLAPLLQLSVVVALIVSDSGVHLLALGYVLVAALGIGIYLIVLVRLLAQQGLLAHLSRDTLRLPFREIFGFSVPLLASDLVFVLRGSLTVILIEVLRTTEEVAEYRAVLPIAIQNLFVATSFRFIFTPGASRLFARGDARALNDLYWQTAAWIALLSFPVFAVSLALAEPVTVLLFGEDYRSAGIVLAVLAVGYYANGAIGFNSLTLRVFGRVRYMVTTDLITAGLSVAASFLLIREFGALGAAIGTTGSLILQNVWYQWGLKTRTTVHPFDRRYLGVYVSIVVGAVGLVVFEQLFDPPLIGGLVVAGLISMVVVGVNRHSLEIAETYPELMRFGLFRRLFGGAPTR
jgi:O-antigen/teichoic acid export membrane protein